MTDAAEIVPIGNDHSLWGKWHWFWYKVFGIRMPTSGDRVHVGNLLVTYQPGQSIEDFRSGKLGTDAQRILKIGDLWVYDYGNTDCDVYISPFRCAPRELGPHDDLLAQNIKDYPRPK